jgi:hypothetical protein
MPGLVSASRKAHFNIGIGSRLKCKESGLFFFYPGDNAPNCCDGGMVVCHGRDGTVVQARHRII